MSGERGDSCSLAQALTARSPKTPMRGGPVSPRLSKPSFKSQAAKTNPSVSMHGTVQGEAPSFLGLSFPPIGRKEWVSSSSLLGRRHLNSYYPPPYSQTSLDPYPQVFSPTVLSSLLHFLYSPFLSFPLLQSLCLLFPTFPFPISYHSLSTPDLSVHRSPESSCSPCPGPSFLLCHGSVASSEVPLLPQHIAHLLSGALLSTLSLSRGNNGANMYRGRGRGDVCFN